MASVTIETTGSMLLGTEIAAAAAALAEYPICLARAQLRNAARRDG
jgi:hypothetical protein